MTVQNMRISGMGCERSEGHLVPDTTARLGGTLHQSIILDRICTVKTHVDNVSEAELKDSRGIRTENLTGAFPVL